MGNPFVHLDLAAADVEGAKKFYGAVFDWQFIDMPDMGYTGISVGDGVGGGIGKTQMPEQPTAWTAYVGVADVKATLEKAVEHGAQVILPYMLVGEMGALAVFLDPQGAAIGLWEEAPKPKAAPKKAAKKKTAKKAATKKKAVAKKAAPKKAAKKKAAKKAAPKKATKKKAVAKKAAPKKATKKKAVAKKAAPKKAATKKATKKKAAPKKAAPKKKTAKK